MIIYCTEEIVIKQIRQKVRYFPRSILIQITNEWTPAAWLKNMEGRTLFIIDEAE